MPILLAEREQCELRVGSNSLGGDAADAIRLTQLSTLPVVGVITVRVGAPPSIQRLSSRVALRVNGTMLGATPGVLREGASIQVGDVRMVYYEDAAAAEAVAPGVPNRRRQSELATQVMAAIAPPPRPAALVALETGKVVRLTGDDLVVGRSEEADVVLTGKGVSRLHALLSVEEGNYILTDESTNGTFVNGARVGGRTVLQPGDIIAFGGEHFRFDHLDSALTRAPSGAPSLAEVEIIRGRWDRTTHVIDRPVCAVGRGAHNDVRVEDESVSASHATFLLKGETWYVTDLRSRGGTYLDGYRVAGERAMSPGSVVRIGTVKMIFWPRGGRKAAQPMNAGSRLLQRLAQALHMRA